MSKLWAFNLNVFDLLVGYDYSTGICNLLTTNDKENKERERSWNASYQGGVKWKGAERTPDANTHKPTFRMGSSTHLDVFNRRDGTHASTCFGSMSTSRRIRSARKLSMSTGRKSDGAWMKFNLTLIIILWHLIKVTKSLECELRSFPCKNYHHLVQTSRGGDDRNFASSGAGTKVSLQHRLDHWSRLETRGRGRRRWRNKWCHNLAKPHVPFNGMLTRALGSQRHTF